MPSGDMLGPNMGAPKRAVVAEFTQKAILRRSLFSAVVALIAALPLPKRSKIIPYGNTHFRISGYSTYARWDGTRWVDVS